MICMLVDNFRTPSPHVKFKTKLRKLYLPYNSIFGYIIATPYKSEEVEVFHPKGNYFYRCKLAQNRIQWRGLVLTMSSLPVLILRVILKVAYFIRNKK